VVNLLLDACTSIDCFRLREPGFRPPSLPPPHTHSFILFFLPLLAVEVYNLTVYRIVGRAMHQLAARDTVFSRIRRYLLVSLVCKGGQQQVGVHHRAQMATMFITLVRPSWAWLS
jgi:hypothetical protein